MSISDDFETIINYAHFFNWAPDWIVAKDIYENIPKSYSVLMPFVYSYLEELIRSTTSEYSMPLLNKDGKKNHLKVGIRLIELAKIENSNNPEYISLLEATEKYYKYESENYLEENGRNNTIHGHLHPRFWTQENFEKLIHDIAELSPFSRF